MDFLDSSATWVNYIEQTIIRINFSTMRIIACIIFIISFLPQIPLAQIATVSDRIDVRSEDSYELVGKVEDKFFIVQDQSDGAKIYCFNSYMKMAWDNDIVCEKKNFTVIGSIVRPDYFGVVLQYKVKGEHLIEFQKIDETGAIIDATIIKNYGKRTFAPQPIIVRSNNQKKLVLFHDREDNLMEAVSFDTESMEVLWDKSLRTDNLSLRNELYQLIVNNKGSFYSIFYKDYPKSQREKNKFTIYKLNATAKSTEEIPFESNFLFDVYFDYDNNNNHIVAGGLYHDKKPFKASGYFYLKYDDNNPNNKILNFEKFSEKIMTTIKGKEADENDSFIHAYVKKLILKSDGGIVIVVERYKKINYAYATTSNPRSFDKGQNSATSIQAEYQYSDILLVDLNAKGKSGWNEILYKRQYSRDDGGRFSSFFIMKNPKKIRFLYNDEIQYNNKISEYSVNRTGKHDRNSILDTDGYNVNLILKEGIQTSKNEIIIPSLRKKSLKLVRIKYNE